MSNIAVERIHTEQTHTEQTHNDKPNDNAPVSSIFNEVKLLMERTREHAFELFEKGGRQDGHAVDDWLNAERDLFRVPESDLIEKDGKFEVQVAAPGFEPGDVQITALPDALIVRAKAVHKHEHNKHRVHFCEFGEKTLFKRVELPEPIDVNHVTANLDKGVLHLVAEKEKPAPARDKDRAA